MFIEADLSTVGGAATVAETVLRKLGGVDIIVHNVGGSKTPGGRFAAATDACWLDELNLNLLAAVRLDRQAYPREIAELVAFLASDRASAIHGAAYVIDCGTIPAV